MPPQAAEDVCQFRPPCPHPPRALTFVRQRKLLLVPPEPRKRDLELPQSRLRQRFIPHHIMRRQHDASKLCQSLDIPR